MFFYGRVCNRKVVRIITRKNSRNFILRCTILNRSFAHSSYHDRNYHCMDIDDYGWSFFKVVQSMRRKKLKFVSLNSDSIAGT